MDAIAKKAVGPERVAMAVCGLKVARKVRMMVVRVEVPVRLRVEGLAMAEVGDGSRPASELLLLLLASSGVSGVLGVVLLEERSSFLGSWRYSFL